MARLWGMDVEHRGSGVKKKTTCLLKVGREALRQASISASETSLCGDEGRRRKRSTSGEIAHISVGFFVAK